MANKIPTSLYDLNNERPTAEEELMTTEMSDEEADLLYKRYKLLQSENTNSLRDIEEEAQQLIQDYTTGAARYADNPERSVRSPAEF